MTVRASMAYLITKVRLLIADPTSLQFQDQDIQDALDARIDYVRYENLTIAPSIVNPGNTSIAATIIYATYYSRYQWWEDNVVVQVFQNNRPWITLVPAETDLITGRFVFELDEFNTALVPGQVPPVFATGATHDIYGAAADLLEMWAATLTGAYDVTLDGQSLHRSQLMQQKFQLAAFYKRKARPKVIKMRRDDVAAPTSGIVSPMIGNESIWQGVK